MPAASSPRRPAAPYRPGQRVRGLHYHPQHGTVATTGTVTACTPRPGGWTLHVAHADEERTYLLSPGGHSDYVSGAVPSPRPAPAGRLHGFYPYPQALAEIPPRYGIEDVPLGEKVLHVHYFTGGCDWWIAEYDSATGRAFGYACLGQPEDAEWGYVDLHELATVRTAGGWGPLVERDLDWTPRTARTADLPGRHGAA